MFSAATDSPQGDVRDLYQDHHVWLVSLLRRKLGNRDCAADFAHDTFVRVLINRQARPEAPLPPEPRAYLTTIARGLVIDHWRRREVEKAYQDMLATLPEAVAPSPEVRLLVMETVCRIDAMLDALAPAVRRAFLLAQVEGLAAPEIAERLGVSRATVDRHIACALRHCYSLRYASESA
jgi:RNA polymerase sigma-70 factor (ECF subfamily)